MTNKESFIFFKSTFEAIEAIPIERKKASCYRVIAEYSLMGKEPGENECYEALMIFRQAKPIIDNANKRYLNCVENGKKGGAPLGNKNASKNKETIVTQKQPKNNQETNKNNLNENDNENVDDIKEREKREKTTEFLEYLSLNYPGLEINVKINSPNAYNYSKLLEAIKESSYLQNSCLSFILQNYTKVVSGYYKSFKQNKADFLEHQYSKEELNSLFDNLDDIKLNEEDIKGNGRL